MASTEHQPSAMVPGARLFTPLAVALHTLFFTPIIGSLLVLTNWTRVGSWARGAFSVIAGLLAVGTLYAVGSFISWKVGLSGLIAGDVGLAIGWYGEQSALFEAHRLEGVKPASPWLLTLVGALFLMAVASWLVYLS